MDYQPPKPNKKKVSVVIVTFNARKYIPYILDSLEQQNFKDYNTVIIDNASWDGTIKEIEQKYVPFVKIVKQKDNVGFARGYNLGIHWTDGEYILALNQDVVLDPDYLSEAVKFMDKHPKVAALQGKIMQWDFASNRKKDFIDNIGIKMHSNHSFTNRFEGEKSPKLENTAEPVFAFSGSCVLLRRQALNEIAYKQEFFDELFFMYKEDIDLSWRLRHKNWDIVYLPTAVAYHNRTIKKNGKNNNLEIAANRYKKRSYLNYISYRNHLYLLLKNSFIKNLVNNFLQISWYELKKLIFIILIEPKTLKAYWDLLKNLKELLKKRKQIISNSKMTSSSFKAWIN